MEDINLCEVCDSSNLYSVLNLGDHPLCDDLIPIGEKEYVKNIQSKFCYAEIVLQLIKSLALKKSLIPQRLSLQSSIYI